MYFGFENIRVEIGKTTVLQDVTLELHRGEMTAVVGPNGSGKTTLLRTVFRGVPCRAGRVLLNDRPLSDYASRELARRIAYLPQSQPLPPDLSVRTLVSYGRFPYSKPFSGESPADRTAIEAALQRTGLASLQDRPLGTLSGGELQRARIAMTLAQEPEILLLDEPTTYLDVGHQCEVMELLSSLNRTLGLTVLLVLHDLNLAARYAHRLCALQNGSVYDIGTPEQVLTPKMLQDLFGLTARVQNDPTCGRPYFLAAAGQPPQPAGKEALQ